MQGVYFYDGFIVGYIVSIFLEYATTKKLSLEVKPFTLAVILLHAVFLAVALTYVDPDKYYIKDIRPVLNILFFAVVLDLYRKTETVFSEKLKDRLFVIAGAASFIKLAFLASGVYGFQDEYYEVNAFRYLDASSYFCAIYLIGRFVSRAPVSAVTITPIIASVASVLLSNSRFILLSLGLAAAGSSLDKPKRIVVVALSGVALASAFYFLSLELDASRIVDNLSVDRIAAQLSNRFGPALELIHEFSGLNYLFGLGAGTTFEIPWFAYRGLETTHSNIDSAYLTYSAKYGLLGLVLLVGFACSAIPKSTISNPARIFIFSMFVVSATPYQPYCIGLISSYLWINRR